MGLTGQETRRQAQFGNRPPTVWLVSAAGALLALDLLFLPWHRFSVDPGRFGIESLGRITLERTAVESPNAGLGIVAVIVAAALALAALSGWLTSRDVTPEASSIRARMALSGGVLALGLLLLKMFLEADFLAIGAWLGVVLAGALAYGGYAIWQEMASVGAAGAGGGAGRGRASRQPRRRWLLLAALVVLGVLAAVWLEDSDGGSLTGPRVEDALSALSSLSLPSIPDFTAPTTAAEEPPVPTTERGDSAATAPPGPGAPGDSPGQAGTTVEPSVAESAETITVSATGAMPERAYVVRFGFSAEGCRSGTTVGGPTTAGADGVIAPTTGVVPPSATPGRYFVCLVAQEDLSTGTPATPLIVP